MKAISLLLVLAACKSPMPRLHGVGTRERQFNQCYLESDSYHEKVEGNIKVEYTVGTDGKVKDKKVLASDFKDPNLNACVLVVLKTLEYPESTMETVMDHQFHFNRSVR